MKKIATLLFILCAYFTIAQNIDPTFNAGYDSSYQQNIGEQSALLPSGKFLSIFYDTTVSVKRIETDGKIDPTFNCNIGTGLYEGRIYILPDSSFLFVSLQSPNGEVFFKKYTANGTLDTSFTPPVLSQLSGLSPVSFYDIKSVIIQADGKIMVGGNFTKINGISKGGIIRLNADGSIDTTFLSGTGLYGSVNCIFRQTDGKYMVCGKISSYNSVARRHILRLNSDGTLDEAFYVLTNNNSMTGLFANGFEDPLNAVAVQADGKIVPVGNSFYVNNTRVDGIVRLNSDGTRDSSFQSLNSLTSIYYYHIIILNDGKILVKGEYGSVSRLNSNGTTDSNFPGGGRLTNNLLAGGFYLAGNKIMVNSHKMLSSGVTRAGFHRMNADGSLDMTFNPSFGLNCSSYMKLGGPLNSSAVTQVAKVLPDGKVLFQGQCSSYNDVGFAKNICRLTIDGNLDSGFVVEPTILGSFSNVDGSLKVTNDGKILCLNSLTVPATPNYYTNLIRLNYNGSLDSSFLYRSDSYNIKKFLPLQSGKILIAGSGSVFLSNGKYKLLRMNNDGTIDTSFNSPLLSTDSSKYSFEEQPDGKILVCGLNPSLSTSTTNYLKRINADGSLDSTFALPSTFYFSSNSTKTQADGKILLSYFVSGFSNPTLKIGRFNSDGTIDASFAIVTDNLSPSTGINYKPVTILSNGEIILSAKSPATLFNGTQLNNSSVIILNANGTINRSFGNTRGTFDMQGCSRLVFSATNGGTFETTLRRDLARYIIDPTNTVNPPSGLPSQNFTNGQTVADLIVSGQNIQWYTTQSECMTMGNGKNNYEVQSLLPSSTPLVNGTTYYASQTIGGIESNYRLPVTANLLLGVNDTVLENVTVFPNPTQGVLTINNTSVLVDRIEIYSMLGEILHSEKGNGESIMNIDLSALNKGVYFLRLYSGKDTKTIKIVKG